MTSKHRSAKELQQDPEYRRNQAERFARLLQEEAELTAIEGPLLADLRAVGIDLSGGVWDLVNMRAPYPKALPVLLRHLRLDYPVRIREGIARAMAVRESRQFWPELVQLYRENREMTAHDVKGGLACALAAASDGRA